MPADATALWALLVANVAPEQLFIALFGVGAITMQYSPRSRMQFLAPFVGLASQPFWLYAAWTASQWGMLFVSTMYTFAWIRGVRRNLKERRNARTG